MVIFLPKHLLPLMGATEGIMPRLCGSERRKEMELPPRLCLGTIYILPFVEGLILLPEYGFRV